RPECRLRPLAADIEGRGSASMGETFDPSACCRAPRGVFGQWPKTARGSRAPPGQCPLRPLESTEVRWQSRCVGTKNPWNRGLFSCADRCAADFNWVLRCAQNDFDFETVLHR